MPKLSLCLLAGAAFLLSPAIAIGVSPSCPTNVAPANGRTGVSLRPTLVSSPFSDPDGNDTHVASQWQVSTTDSFEVIAWDSGEDDGNLTSTIVPANLKSDSQYWWHVRYKYTAAGTLWNWKWTPYTTAAGDPSKMAVSGARTPLSSLTSPFAQRRAQMLAKGYRCYEHPEGKFAIFEKPSARSANAVNASAGNGINGSVDFGYGTTLNCISSFEPLVDSEIDFSGFSLQYARAVVGGELSLQALLSCTVSGSASFSTNITLFERTVVAYYSIGGVPVYQEITFGLDGEIDFEGNFNIDMDASATFAKTVRFGVEWQRGVGWQPIRENGFQREMTFILAGQAGATVRLRLIPRVGTTFYKTAEIGISVIPELGLDAAAQLTPVPTLTQFDVFFQAGIEIEAALKAFSVDLYRWNSGYIGIVDPITLFSLPSVSFVNPPSTGQTSYELPYQLDIANGVNNAVVAANIAWSASPSSGVTMSLSGAATASTTTDTSGNYSFTGLANGSYTVPPKDALRLRFLASVGSAISPGRPLIDIHCRT